MADKEPQVELCVIIAIIQGMYAGIVESCRIKIKDFSMFMNHYHYHYASCPITMLVGSSKSSICLISSSSKLIIDSGATNQMTGNSSLFSTSQPHSSTSIVILADGSTSCVLGLRTIHPTLLITLTFVMSLSQFSFNLISMSKLTCTHNCSISFFFLIII